ncbi:MAG: TonB-dependent receptor [Williamsia sp.]|nr:TonB-dependent receptor [Williamsia sp.]
MKSKGLLTGFFLFMLSLTLQAQNAPAAGSVLQGTITDSKTKEPLQGATVAIKGTNSSTVTDGKGQFSLRTEQKFPFTLLVSHVGYTPAERQASGPSLSVELAPAEQSLSDVVVVAYGTQKKITLTNSVSQISGAELTKRPVSNVQQALQGQLPGVTVLDQGGSPGNSAATIRVRGITTFNTNGTSGTLGFDLSKNDALVIVDGSEQRLTDLNPNDIETITVLKDAASTAIYGSRATNGVILVTTKSAKAGQAQVSYDGYVALQQAINKPVQMGMQDYMYEQKAAYANAGLPVPAKFSDSSIAVWVNATDRYKYPLPNTWFATLLRTAPQTSHSVSVSGGSDVIRSRLSVRYQDQDGIIKNYGNKIAEIRLNTDYNAAKNLSFNANIDYRFNYINQPTVDPINNFFHGSMWAVPKYPNGTYGLSTQGNNPLMFVEKGGQTVNRSDYFTGSVQGNWTIVKGLRFSSFFSGRIYYTQGKAFANAYTNVDSVTGIVKTVANNTLTETRNNLREYTWNNLLTYQNTFGQHHVNVLAGYSQIHNVQTFLSAYRERFYSNDIQSISQGTNDATKSNGGYDAEYALRSYFGRINYDYAGKYLLEVNGRYDGSSKFTGSKQYGFFPSFSAGWVVSEEPFWDRLKESVPDFKLRGSYGITGNQSVDLYSYYASLTLAGYDFGGQSVNGYRQTTLANKELGWESTNQLDIGLDATALNRRLNLTVDYYRKVTNDILLNLNIPATVGLIAPFQNAGSVENKGWEFSANYNSPRTEGGFHYSIGANLAINSNKVLDLKGTGPYITGSDIDPRYIIAKGLPINALWGYQTDGLFQSQQEIDSYKATYASNTKPGDVKYVDRNKDGKIDANDMTVIGNSFPKYTYGLNTTLSYGHFDLGILFQGAAKVDTRLSGALAEMGDQEGFTHEIYAGNYWTPTNTGARFPRPVKYDLRNVATSDRLVYRGDYLRLKNIQLAYTIPAAFLQRTRIQRLRFYVAATNVLTLSRLNEWNLDPETPSGRAVYYPQTALYTFGVNLQF